MKADRPPPQVEERNPSQPDELRRMRSRQSGCGAVIVLLALLAAGAWFLLKGLPALKRRQAALGADTWQPPPKTPFVRGIDYDVKPPDDDGD